MKSLTLSSLIGEEGIPEEGVVEEVIKAERLFIVSCKIDDVPEI